MAQALLSGFVSFEKCAKPTETWLTVKQDTNLSMQREKKEKKKNTTVGGKKGLNLYSSLR